VLSRRPIIYIKTRSSATAEKQAYTLVIIIIIVIRKNKFILP